MLQAVIFDMDGVLFDTEPLSAEGWRVASRQFGIPVDEDILQAVLGSNADSTRETMLRAYGPDFPFDAMNRVHWTYVSDYIAEHGVPVKPGVRSFLAYLKSIGLPTAVASSSTRQRVLDNLRGACLSEFFGAVVGGEDIAHSKPAPDIYLAAAHLLGVSPERCAAIEDSPNGLLSAKRAGMVPIMIPDLIPPDRQDSARFCFSSMDELHRVWQADGGAFLDAPASCGAV